MNITPLFTITGFGSLVNVANNSTEGHLIGMFIVAIFFIILARLRYYPFEYTVFVATWACFVVSSFLAYVQWINLIYPIAFLVATAMASLYLWFGDK